MAPVDVTARITCCIALGLAIACTGERAQNGAATRADGTVVVAFNAETQSFNPLVNTDQNTNEVNYYMLFTPLIQYDKSFEPTPYLARSWDLEPQ